MAGMTLAAWASMFGAIAVLWGSATWALYRSLTDEDEKLELIEQQGEIDTYSPRALAELREWVTTHPEDPLVGEARERYNDCVEILRRVDETFYDWSDSEAESLEKLYVTKERIDRSGVSGTDRLVSSVTLL